MLDRALWLIGDSFLPYVEDPLPERIGLGFPFAMAGVGGVLAEIFFSDAFDGRRDRVARLGIRIGFAAGWVFYLISLVIQLA